MPPTSFLVSDRPAFQEAWREALIEVGFDVRTLQPDALAQSAAAGQVLVIDAGASLYDEDELLASVGMLRAMRAVVAVALPDAHTFSGVEELLEDLCSGLVSRGGGDVRRIAQTLARRRDAHRSKRFEYLTVSPRPNELLAVFGDGSAMLLPRPVNEQDDGSEVAGITLANDAHAATLLLGSGQELTLRAAAFGQNGTAAHLAADGGSQGLLAVDGARLGARLRELRLAAGLTQAELARRTGIHRPNIARVEAGRHTPSLETLARLASAIGVSTTVVLREA